MNNKKENPLLEQLLLGISDVSTNCRLLLSESEKAPRASDAVAFLRRGVLNLSDELESLVQQARTTFEIVDSSDDRA